MSESAHRRTTSELDLTSMRRIGDALLLAQNRARCATDRANQAEQVLRLVLSQINVRRLHIGSLSDTEVLRANLVSNLLLERRPIDVLELSSSEGMSSVPSSSHDTNDVAKDIVTNLSAAMSRHKNHLKQVRLPTNRLSLMGYMDDGFINPVCCAATFLIGLLVGIAATNLWHLRTEHAQKNKSLLFGRLAKWYSRRVPAVNSLNALLTYNYSYLMYPAITEVV